MAKVNWFLFISGILFSNRFWKLSHKNKFHKILWYNIVLNIIKLFINALHVDFLLGERKSDKNCFFHTEKGQWEKNQNKGNGEKTQVLFWLDMVAIVKIGPWVITKWQLNLWEWKFWFDSVEWMHVYNCEVSIT